MTTVIIFDKQGTTMVGPISPSAAATFLCGYDLNKYDAFVRVDNLPANLSDLERKLTEAGEIVNAAPNVVVE